MAETEVRVRMRVKVFTEEDEGRWIAYVPPTGIVVYADSEEGARERMATALHFLASGVHITRGADWLRAYLTRHGIKHSVSVKTTVAVQDSPKVEVLVG